MPPRYNHWDIKYYWRLHKARQQIMEQPSISYVAFYNRIKKWMTLKEAIYTPSNTNMARYNMKPNRYKNLRYRFISFFK